MTHRRHDLHDGWTLHLVRAAHGAPRLEPLADGRGITAEVPGCVHLDLLRHGLIDDPYVDLNEESLHWIGLSDWEYRTTFDMPADHVDLATPLRGDLVCPSLDTIATVTLNGVVVGTSRSVHRSLRFAIDGVLRARHNDLRIAFASPTEYAMEQERLHGPLPNPYERPYNFIRKAAANFGWDWGPWLTTSGIAGPVTVETWSGARIAAVRPVIGMDGRIGTVDVVVDLEWAPTTGEPVTIVASVHGRHGSMTVRPGTSSVCIPLRIPDVDLWWPRGRGAQTRYPLRVELRAAPGTGARDPQQVIERRIGFRVIDIEEQAADGSGGESGRWALRVNGERVWIRGLNWIPDDCFSARVTRQRVTERIGQAVAANANLLRIWGGGYFESDDFYDACDELGVLVWQDFPFACAAYPEASIEAEVRLEARDAVNRLMWRPSLALWNGNNECLEGWADWGWKDTVGERPWGGGLYHRAIPEVLAELDPQRAYIPGSPMSPDQSVGPNHPSSGPIHIWDVWNDLDYTHYRTYQPLFVAEFGFQAPPNRSTMEEAVTSRPLQVMSAGVQHHQKAVDGQLKLQRALTRHFGPRSADTYDNWTFFGQLNQARAIEVGIGHLRSLHERCSGAVWWQLNDCWPVASWAIVDAAARPKLGWYAVRRLFADRALVIEPRDGRLCVILVNDARSVWSASLSVVKASLDGTRLASAELSVEVAGDGATVVPLPDALAMPDDPMGEVLVVTAGRLRSAWAWATDVELAQHRGAAPARWAARVEQRGDAVLVTVQALTFVRDLCLLADLVHPDARVDDQLITLLPAEMHTFTVSGLADLWGPGAPDAALLARLTSPEVLRDASPPVDVPVPVGAATGSLAGSSVGSSVGSSDGVSSADGGPHG